MKVAAQLYSQFTNSISEIVLEYKGMTADDTPYDPTEGLVDVGELASTFKDIESDYQEDAFLEEGLLDE
jgi:hypothetical protein